jgi:dCTP diphosphatase
MQSRPTFEQVRDAVMAHVRARGWDEENTGRGLAISISLEASELLEYFQWQEENIGDGEDLASELADIIIYAIQFADKYGIDILPEVLKKLDKTAKKYPVEIFEIEDKEERNRVWREAKLSYEKDTTL